VCVCVFRTTSSSSVSNLYGFVLWEQNMAKNVLSVFFSFQTDLLFTFKLTCE